MAGRLYRADGNVDEAAINLFNPPGRAGEYFLKVIMVIRIRAHFLALFHPNFFMRACIFYKTIEKTTCRLDWRLTCESDGVSFSRN